MGTMGTMGLTVEEALKQVEFFLDDIGMCLSQEDWIDLCDQLAANTQGKREAAEEEQKDSI